MHKIVSIGKTDCGLKRANNEDTFLVKPELGFFVVADGMGGAAAGELASKIFAEAAEEIFSSPEGLDHDPSDLVQQAFGLANERILRHTEKVPKHKGMGTTAELLVFSGDRFIIGHMGDSRTYRFKNGQLKQLTQDHSLVQGQLDQGLITPEEARTHSLRNVILRAVGVDETPALDIIRGNLTAGDVFLLCSDGLTDPVDDASITNVLANPSSLDQKAAELIELAKNGGGRDNITVVLVGIE